MESGGSAELMLYTALFSHYFTVEYDSYHFILCILTRWILSSLSKFKI